MKQKYTITVAGMEINIVTDQSPETVDNIVSTIDRRIREINLRSPLCSRTESALLCAMDYCADKLALADKVKSLEFQIEEFSKAGTIIREADVAEKEERIRYLEQCLAKATEERDSLRAKVDELSDALSRESERAALLEAGINDLADELKSKIENEISEESVPEAKPIDKPRIRVRKYNESTQKEADSQLTIDGVDIPEAAPSVKRERRRPSAYDLINSDDI